MDNFANLQLKDFLLLYNKITESCFVHCVNQLGQRDLTQDECSCVDVCTKKYVNVNNKVMQVYMEVQSQIINRKIEEVNKQQAAISAKVKDINPNKTEVPSVNVPKVNSAVV
ncbi:UNVERIFIED_CONTAM: hypothetical protein PYX00_007437 [Menopon gallinae]|uniref:Mitochondrial import inner membrane translocase subunit n=1 Tax=Menopon gallinae TaxID=328185 RepID=A0AAW2HK11_9NEOP